MRTSLLLSFFLFFVVFLRLGGFSEFAGMKDGQPARPLSFVAKFQRPAQQPAGPGRPMQL